MRREEYIAYPDMKDATHLEVSVYYSKGGMNYLSGGQIVRGYYLSVKPVSKSNGMISFTLFAGTGMLLFETKRYSEKQFQQALIIAKGHEKKLIERVLSDCRKTA